MKSHLWCRALSNQLTDSFVGFLWSVLGIPEAMKHTPAGQEGSRKHNSMLRLATMRYAMIAQLRSPPCGFEEVTLRHFSMCRKRLIVQARRWMLEEKRETNSSLIVRFERAYAELLHLLSSERIRGQPYGSLPPLREDLTALQALDSGFFSSSLPVAEEIDNKQPASQDASMVKPHHQSEMEDPEVAAKAAASMVIENNPWANGGVWSNENGSQPLANESDDELYL
jgi:hypothetical protein